MRRLYAAVNARLTDRALLAGAYSIADIACIGCARLHKRQGQDLAEFPHLRHWFDAMMARSAVQRGTGVRSKRRAMSISRTPPCAPCGSTSAPGNGRRRRRLPCRRVEPCQHPANLHRLPFAVAARGRDTLFIERRRNAPWRRYAGRL